MDEKRRLKGRVRGAHRGKGGQRKGQEWIIADSGSCSCIGPCCPDDLYCMVNVALEAPLVT